MGWFWQSPAGSRPASPSSTGTDPARPSPTTTTTPTTPKKTPADDDIDSEIAKFIALFQEELRGSSSSNQPQTSAEPVSQPKPTPSSSPSSSSPSSPSSGWSSWLSRTSHSSSSTTHPRSPADPHHQEEDEAAPEPPISETLLPVDMNCRQAFDHAFHCQSPGGQWNAIYRYGALRDCGELWEDFWFCMRTKGYTGPMKAEAIRAHYRDKEARKYGGVATATTDGQQQHPRQPSSEDIWQARPRPVEPGTAFTDRYDWPQDEVGSGGDQEWRAAEMERRRRIRAGLGFEDRAATA